MCFLWQDKLVVELGGKKENDFLKTSFDSPFILISDSFLQMK